jgi:hypothetical protein
MMSLLTKEKDMKKFIVTIATAAAMIGTAAEAHDQFAIGVIDHVGRAIAFEHCANYGHCGGVGYGYNQPFPQQYYNTQPQTNFGYYGAPAYRAPYVQCNVVIQQNYYGAPVYSSVPCR